MPEQRQYKINIDPRILELLGPSLYTNIYYVLAELIANSYDADAANVYIIQKKDRIIVEDDGKGMSYKDGEIAKYLDVAVETRTKKEDSYTDKQRRRIGRKGLGKLAALSVSENVLVLTKQGRERSGFVLSRRVGKDHLLESIEPDQVVFEKVKGSGTSIVMTNPQYGMHKTPDAIKRNLLKIFPLVNKDFRIHFIVGAKPFVISSFDAEMVQGLGALICLGSDFHHLAKHFDPQLPSNGEVENQLLKLEKAVAETLELKNKKGKNKKYKLEMKGWIGAYKTTRDRKRDAGDFPDNFVSLLANGKLGEYNILPIVGRNRLQEVYVVGQLHVDLFEETELPDMALSNRQGYKSDDPRYRFVVEYVREKLLPRILGMRQVFGDAQRKEKEKLKTEKQLKAEQDLRKKVDDYKSRVSQRAANKIVANANDVQLDRVKQIIERELNQTMPIIGLKSKVDVQKKKILICHVQFDKPLADVVYKMLSFNHISDADLIYTSCDNEAARIPEATGIYDYLREFFVNSYSDQKIIVLYVTSNEMAKSWGAVTEVGAGWITRQDHKIFNVKGHRPQRPLNIDAEWQTSNKDGDRISMTKVEFDKFIVKIRSTCDTLGFRPKSKSANETELKRYVSIQ